MQKLMKMRDDADDKSRKVVKTADKKGRGLWETIAAAVSDAFAGATGRKKAEQKRKRVAAGGAAGVAAIAGAAGVLLAKRKSRDSEAEREAAYQVPQPPVAPTNGAAQTVPSSSEPSA